MNTDKTKTPHNANTNNGAGRGNKLAYRDGYLHGRDTENRIQEENRIVRENNSAATGLLYGITITALLGLIGGAIFLLTHRDQPSTRPVQVVPVPNTSQPQSPQRQTTIIQRTERTVDRTREIVPIPPQQSPTLEAEPEAQSSPAQHEAGEPESAGNEAQGSAPQP